MAKERPEQVRRNPQARALADPRFYKRVVKPRKGKGAYDRRKAKTVVREPSGQGAARTLTRRLAGRPELALNEATFSSTID